MYIGWTHHLKDEKEKEQFANSIYGSKRVLDRLKAIIDALEEEVDQTERDPKAYENPAWAYKQAYKNGYRSGLKTIQNIVDLDKQRPPKENNG